MTSAKNDRSNSTRVNYRMNSPNLNRLDAYDYELPAELIASAPSQQRDQSRLMVLNRKTETIAHHHFYELPNLLQPQDRLVFNRTKVVPARLRGTREATGGKWEGLFIRLAQSGCWQLLGKSRGKLQTGEHILIDAAEPSSNLKPLKLRLTGRAEEGMWTAVPQRSESEITHSISPEETWELLENYGDIPLPPYIERATVKEDQSRYQTVYANEPGAVAAPTAGLHFTPELIQQAQAKGIESSSVVLHVGIGTFRPINAQNLSEHEMHHEWCSLPQSTFQELEATKTSNGRIVAVGTTSVRTLETAAQLGQLRPFEGETNLFIRPPYQFQATGAMITNFHLPKSSLLVMISAFAGYDFIKQAYQEAISEKYRFFSYGDAMLIL